MSERVTIKHLEAVVHRINLITKSPLSTYEKLKNGKFKACAGNYHLYQAYGAVALHRICKDGHGSEIIIGLGTKRELYLRMQSFLMGVMYAKG